jgi:hypothetical protein
MDMNQQQPPPGAQKGNGLMIGGIILIIAVVSAVVVTVQYTQLQRATVDVKTTGGLEEAQRHEQEAQTAAAAAKQAALAEIEKAKKQEISALASSPGNYLEWSDPKTFDEGIIQDYRRLTGITILNKAHFAVTDIQGNVTFTDDDGHPFGAMPFSITGSIPAGDTKVFGSGTLTSSTLKGRPTKLAVSFTRVRVIP